MSTFMFMGFQLVDLIKDGWKTERRRRKQRFFALQLDYSYPECRGSLIWAQTNQSVQNNIFYNLTKIQLWQFAAFFAENECSKKCLLMRPPPTPRLGYFWADQLQPLFQEQNPGTQNQLSTAFIGIIFFEGVATVRVRNLQTKRTLPVSVCAAVCARGKYWR